MQPIQDNSRAAFYLKARRNSPGLTAARAYEMAARQVEWHAAARAESDAAAETLAAMWADLGHVEPKRYAPEGVALAILPGKDGAARYLPGYQFGGQDCGISIDLEQMTDCERDAARRADSLAENAAESEKEYQAAWGAGNRWADLAGQVKDARAAALALLKERRAAMARAGDNLPAICRAIRDSVAGHVESIREAREEMAELAGGNAESYWFYTGESRLRAAFCEGAGLQEMPA